MLCTMCSVSRVGSVVRLCIYIIYIERVYMYNMRESMAYVINRFTDDVTRLYDDVTRLHDDVTRLHDDVTSETCRANH